MVEAAFLAGGGEMGELIRAHDWSCTAIGPVSGWSSALRMQVAFLLANRFPMLLWWGPTFCSIYNDAYIPVLGAKHPWALGKPVSDCWSEIWDVLQPLIETPFRGGPPTWIEDFELELRRQGYPEEAHFTVAYSPVPDETAPGGIGGVVATVHEISATVFADRRVAVLRDLGARAGEAKTAEQACAIAAETLGAHGKDLPFVLLYLFDPPGRAAHLAGAAGVAPGADAAPLTLHAGANATPWPIDEARRREVMIVVERLDQRFAERPAGPWADPPHTAVVVPIPSHKAHEPVGMLVAGISSRMELDAHYRDFITLLTTQIATAIANARAYEEERRRAEALAEIDRAKTAFFSNVSHEFRTPLTLMLGPVETLLQHPALPADARSELAMMNRNGMRLLRLVNTLLDFSRIEAGRARASFQPTDLARLTTELASVFRAAVEKAGLRLEVDCPSLPEPVFVDRDMWERIVLNLLSNAFKFTFEGSITVSLWRVGDHAELRVRDTGLGIAPEEMPRLFERFHRVHDARGRTHEGTGIGLALVHELVKQHGGAIHAASEVGRGTMFTVAMPFGSKHLPPTQIAPPSPAERGTSAAAFVEEALRWLPDVEEHRDGVVAPRTGPAPERAEAAPADRPRVLVADDNADMRQYIVRLLADRYLVDAYPDGATAWDAIRARPPELVLSDVMMPHLDGFGLLREVRADPATRDLPVIMLSARAGEESRVEGMEAGADDYLIKPFGARELLARVGAHLHMARVRREAAESLREADRRKDEFLATLAHELRNPLAPLTHSLEVLKRAHDPAVIESSRATMERQTAHMVRLVDDLLDMSRITVNQLLLRRERTDLAGIVQRAVEASRPLLEANEHELRVTLPSQPVLLDADPARLAQVFGNLLANACKFTPARGLIELNAELLPPATPHAVPDAAELMIQVRDNGEGIPPDMLATVFEMFRQVERSVERSRSGLGIGLTLVKRLVEMHGGSVTAESAGPGRGSTFTMRLPVLVGAVEPAAAEPEPEPVVATGRRVLIVDDNVDAAVSLEMLLQLAGNRTAAIHDGREATRRAEAFRPDLILLDIGMPGMSGYEVCRAIRAEPWGKDIVIIALTGWGQDEDRRRSKDAGFDDHMVKPVRSAAVMELIASLPAAAPTSAAPAAEA